MHLKVTLVFLPNNQQASLELMTVDVTEITPQQQLRCRTENGDQRLLKEVIRSGNYEIRYDPFL